MADQIFKSRPLGVDWLREAHDLELLVVGLRQQLHRFPEIGLHLPLTTQAVRKALDGLDLRYDLASSSSGFVATLVGRYPGPTVLLRADMDALPMDDLGPAEYRSEITGCMHACGHDAHAAMLVGAAHLLHRHRETLHGAVRFMFQAGEEDHFGARSMIEDGLLDTAPQPDAAFAIHVWPNARARQVLARPGAMLAAADQFTVTIKGRGGHASRPHQCLDPIPVAAEMVLAIQAMVARRIDIFQPVVVTVGMINAGTAANIIPETASLSGTIRSFSETSRETIHQALTVLTSNIASAHGMVAELDLRPGYPATVNDQQVYGLVRAAAISLLGEDRFTEVSSPFMAAEDFSYVLRRVPGCMIFLGAAPEHVDASLASPCHSPLMSIDESALTTGTALHAAVAARILAGMAPSCEGAQTEETGS